MGSNTITEEFWELLFYIQMVSPVCLLSQPVQIARKQQRLTNRNNDGSGSSTWNCAENGTGNHFMKWCALLEMASEDTGGTFNNRRI